LQYVASNIPGNEESNEGYRDDPTVPAQSNTPTYASMVLYINNERWEGVPFIMKCGKGVCLL
jgi:glucose-6-phosphate 1-dehydrogenase